MSASSRVVWLQLIQKGLSLKCESDVNVLAQPTVRQRSWLTVGWSDLLGCWFEQEIDNSFLG
jgi:hypothetical protein